MANELLYVVDDDANLRRILAVLLQTRGHRVMEFENGEQCLQALDENPATIFMDMRMPGMDGIETLKRIRQERTDIPVIMVTSVDDVDTAVNAIKLGAFDYIVKPYEEARLLTDLEKALQQNALVNRVRHLEGELKGLHDLQGIVGQSDAIRKVLEKVNKVKDSKANVLIQGESGTGKELIARAIHYNSQFARGLFVDINCGAIPETLQESELFGHKKGAFTGAVESRTGKLERSDGGTLFLDEVAEMSANTQTKLLRFLQEKNFERIGENTKVTVDTRVIAATNKDLKKEIADGHFREDLYYRLAVFPIFVPPLRERTEDIPLLCAHILQKYQSELNKTVNTIQPEAMNHLMRQSWPGNIRQLENVLYQAMINSETESIGLESLPKDGLSQTAGQGAPVSSAPAETSPEPAAETVEAASEPAAESGPTDGGDGVIVPIEEMEKRALAHALKVTGGNIPKAAKELGISRSTIYRMVKKYGLQ